jgi:hypothetical protein
MQNIVFAMLKILKLCKITYIYIVTKCIKIVLYVKLQIILKDYMDNKSISENAVGSYPIVKCTYHLG